jgi:NADH dehydrogenase
VRGHPEVFAIGDLAAVPIDGKPLPMVSPVAIQEGDQAARNVIAALEGRPLSPFRYQNRGIMATIGRNQAVAELGPLRFTGFLAWLVWLFVHLALLIGFRNRIMALLSWGIDYFFYDRPVRLITMAPPLAPTQSTDGDGNRPSGHAATGDPLQTGSRIPR